MSDANDRLIWGLGTGSALLASKDLVMEDDQQRAFTAGTTYRVKSMHPIAEPAYVIVVDDQGEDHKLNAEHVREYFFSAGEQP